MTYSLYSIPVTIDVIAKGREQAENLICDILDRAFIYGVGYKEAEIQRTQTATDVARVFDFEIKEVKEGMIWQDVKGEILTYDGTKECESMLLDRDLFTWKGHLCEGYSLHGYEDYGPINVGDRVLILHDLDEVVILKKREEE